MAQETSSFGKANMALGISSMVVALFDTYSNIEALKAQNVIEQSRARIASANARFMGREAIYASRRQASSYRAMQNSLTGRQVAAISSQGIDPRSGSAAQAVIESRYLGDLEILSAETSGKMAALGYEMEAINAESQAAYSRIASKYGQRQTLLSGLSSLTLSGAMMSMNKLEIDKKNERIAQLEVENKIQRKVLSSGRGY